MKTTLIALALVLVAGCSVEELDPQAKATPQSSAQAAEARRIAANEAAAKASADAAAARKEAAEDAASALAAQPPNPAHFKIELVVLEKSCFGSAGCNITYRIDPTYTGPSDISDTEVTYEVTGGESGPQVNTFEIDGSGQATFDSSEFLSTSTSRPNLRAKVTSVRRN